MKIRERSMALLLALMMVLGLTACGKKAVEAEPYNGIVYVGEDLPLDAELQRIKGSCVLGDFVYLAGHAPAPGGRRDGGPAGGSAL